MNACRFTTAQATARAVPIIRIGRQEGIVVGTEPPAQLGVLKPWAVFSLAPLRGSPAKNTMSTTT